MAGDPTAPSAARAVTVADLLATVDWSRTGLGPREQWPAGLAAVLNTLLAAPFPVALVYGDSFTLVYNDAYASVIGAKHPTAFGRPAPEVLAENWDQPGHGDRVERVLRTGEAFFEAETLLPVRRRGPSGPVEQVHFSRAYTAVRDDQGAVVGVLSVINETTEAVRTLASVADLATRLSSALSVDDVARETLRHAVEGARADHARVLLSEGPSMRMARRSGIDEHDESVDRLPPVWVRVPATTVLPSVEVTQHRQALWLDEEALQAYPGLLDEPGASRLATVVSVPLHTGQVQGALSLGWEQPRAITAADRAAFVTVGNVVGQALARAQRFDEQRGHAETLQRSMLPAELPHVPGTSVAARYQPSAPGTSAGGDFYDAFQLPDGRLMLAIGDVVGHGVIAATVMGQVRAALRVLALRRPDPVDVLGGLDPFVASLGPETFVTAVVGVLDVATGLLELATAGHPAPLVRRRARGPGGTVTCEFLPVTPAPPLGVPGPRETTEVELHQGDVVLLFTDGLVEVAGQDLGIGLEQLRSLAAKRPDVSDPRRMCALVLDELGTGEDDIAVVAVTVDDSARRTSALDLPAESTAPGSARAWATATLSDWGLDDDTVQSALLGINELVTNALLHARSGSRVELDLDAHRLLVLVTDAGITTTVRPQQADPSAVRGRGLAMIEAISDAWGSERSSRGTTVWFELVHAGGADGATGE